MKLKLLLITTALFNINPSYCADGKSDTNRLSNSFPETGVISLFLSIKPSPSIPKFLTPKSSQSSPSLPAMTQEDNSSDLSDDDMFSVDESELDAFFEESQKINSETLDFEKFDAARRTAFPGAKHLSDQKLGQLVKEVCSLAAQPELDIPIDHTSLFHLSTLQPTYKWYKRRKQSIVYRSLK